jgi:hypothetical protein
MIDWIKKTIHPPGIQKKNRLSLFSAIGEIAERVRADALKAFNAHFPYLADEKKLEEHGNALLIPRLIEDTPKEYRDRVTAASFFLMRAGERAYILEQLNAHFGDRYVVSEDFLRLYVKILEISDSDRSWVHGFLDGLLDPNISLTVADWFRFVEHIVSGETLHITARTRLAEVCSGQPRYDGRWYYDQGREILFDGSWNYDGGKRYAGVEFASGTTTNIALRELYYDGRWSYNGSKDYSGYEKIQMEESIPAPVAYTAPADTLNVAVMINGMADSFTGNEFLTVRIVRPFRYDGRYTYSYRGFDGNSFYDGSWNYTGLGANGRYYRADIIEEVL